MTSEEDAAPAPQPHWEHGYRCHGYWLDSVTRVGYVGLPPKHWRTFTDRLVYSWGVTVPDTWEQRGELLSLAAAKRKVERTYRETVRKLEERRAARAGAGDPPGVADEAVKGTDELAAMRRKIGEAAEGKGRAPQLRALADFINHAFPEMEARVLAGHCVTDRFDPSGNRRIPGKGRRGNRLEVYRRGEARAVFTHNAAGTYRKNREVCRWIVRFEKERSREPQADPAAS